MTFYTHQIHAHLKGIQSIRCATPGCKNLRAFFIQHRLRKDGVWVEQKHTYVLCWKCHTRAFKKRCLISYVLNTVRKNARRRGIPCSLTLEEFTQFCHETGYDEHKGQSPEDLTIDRIDHDKGYHIWNIRVLTHEENSLLGHMTPNSSQQNAHKPTEWDYDFEGPEPDYIPPMEGDQPF